LDGGSTPTSHSTTASGLCNSRRQGQGAQCSSVRR
jgi:hypothetical protein